MNEQINASFTQKALRVLNTLDIYFISLVMISFATPKFFNTQLQVVEGIVYAIIEFIIVILLILPYKKDLKTFFWDHGGRFIKAPQTLQSKKWKANIPIVFLLVLIIPFFACNNSSNSGPIELVSISTDTTNNIIKFTGAYVDKGYTKRAEGYDWVGVSINQVTDSTIHVAIRSRFDLKKPTCTFDADAVRIGDNLFQSIVDGKVILYKFSENTVNIATEKVDDNSVLQYYCSGGGSFGGEYAKVDGPLDKLQVDPRVFIKMLSLQNVFFEVFTTGEGSIQQLSIQTYGLKKSTPLIKMEVDGKVTDAEIEDLNADGFPELLVYTNSAGSGRYGDVIGYSVNAGKSLSQIYFPPITEDTSLNKGYMGHDAFAIVENNLVRRFPIYKTSDPNNTPTGGIRQVHYKVKEGESSRKFVVDKILEFK